MQRVEIAFTGVNTFVAGLEFDSGGDFRNRQNFARVRGIIFVGIARQPRPPRRVCAFRTRESEAARLELRFFANGADAVEIRRNEVNARQIIDAEMQKASAPPSQTANTSVNSNTSANQSAGNSNVSK